MKTYFGNASGSGESFVVVEEGPETRRLAPPTGVPAFYWGHQGDGSWALAVALLADALGDTLPPRHGPASVAWRLHTQFERDIVQKWRTHLPFKITDTEIIAWVKQEQAKQSHTESSNSPVYGARKSTPDAAESEK